MCLHWDPGSHYPQLEIVSEMISFEVVLAYGGQLLIVAAVVEVVVVVVVVVVAVVVAEVVVAEVVVVEVVVVEVVVAEVVVVVVVVVVEVVAVEVVVAVFVKCVGDAAGVEGAAELSAVGTGATEK